MSTEKKQDSSAKLVLVLFAISVVTALLLGLVNMVTAPVIAANNERVAAEAKAEVLPSQNEYEDVTDQYTGGDPNVLGVYKAGEDGYVVEIQSSGFGGMVKMTVGVGADGACTGVSITSHSETSGLGANATDETWREQFKGASGDVKVTKDNGTIDALTGSTITSRAVCSGVTTALEVAASMG